MIVKLGSWSKTRLLRLWNFTICNFWRELFSIYLFDTTHHSSFLL